MHNITINIEVIIVLQGWIMTSHLLQGFPDQNSPDGRMRKTFVRAKRNLSNISVHIGSWLIPKFKMHASNPSGVVKSCKGFFDISIPRQSKPALRHCRVSSPWPQKSSAMSMSFTGQVVYSDIRPPQVLKSWWELHGVFRVIQWTTCLAYLFSGDEIGP